MQCKRLAGLAIIAIMLLTACSKKGPSYTRFIPKDANYVIALDVKEMISKLEKDSLTVENMMEVLKDSAHPGKYSEAMAIWGQFKDAGLDFESKVLLAVPAIDMQGNEIDIQVLAGLKDAGKLQDFISKMPNAPAVKKDGDISYATKDEMIIGWNSEAVMILASPTSPQMNFDEEGGDEPAVTAPPVPGESASLAKLKKYFGLKKEESMADVAAFNDLMGKKADIAVFTNSDALAGQSNPALAMMPKVKELVSGIYSASTINFEDGKVVMVGDTYVNEKLAGIIKEYTGPTVDMDLINPYPSTNVNGVVAWSFKPELIGALLKEAGVDALADLALSQQGTSTTELLKAFKGDVAVMVSDFSIAKVEKANWEGEKYFSTEPTMKVLSAVRIGDKATFDKLINMLVKQGMLIKQGNRLVLANNGQPEAGNEMIVGIENDLLIIATDEAVYSGYVAKKSKVELSDNARAHIKGASMAIFADAGKILNGIPETVMDSSEVHQKNILARAKPLFKTMSLTTGKFDGKKMHAEGEMTLAEGKNSLPQLVRFLMYVADEMKQSNNERKANWDDVILDVDSSAVTPPVM